MASDAADGPARAASKQSSLRDVSPTCAVLTG